jgi:hypothetical protein
MQLLLHSQWLLNLLQPFIKEVGFYPEGTEINGVDVGGTPVYIDFKYPKEIMPYQPGKTYLKVFAIEIVDGGSGYGTTPPQITFSTPGEGEITAEARATLDGGVITSITIFAGGSYLTPANGDNSSTAYIYSCGTIKSCTGFSKNKY